MARSRLFFFLVKVLLWRASRGACKQGDLEERPEKRGLEPADAEGGYIPFTPKPTVRSKPRARWTTNRTPFFRHVIVFLPCPTRTDHGQVRKGWRLIGTLSGRLPVRRQLGMIGA